MYKLARAFFVYSVVLMVYCLGLVCLLAGPVALWCLLLMGFFALLKRKKIAHLTTLGSGRFATDEEIRNAGMTTSNTGLFLGWIGSETKGSFHRAVKALFSNGLKAKEACLAFLDGGKKKGEMVRLNAYHTVCFARSRSGKGVSLIIPWLRSVNESAIVIDVKGENAFLSMRWREAMGQRVIILDPFKLVTR
jgi:type IV secretory pathway TraG/TraD family ATPase VirD4